MTKNPCGVTCVGGVAKNADDETVDALDLYDNVCSLAAAETALDDYLETSAGPFGGAGTQIPLPAKTYTVTNPRAIAAMATIQGRGSVQWAHGLSINLQQLSLYFDSVPLLFFEQSYSSPVTGAAKISVFFSRSIVVPANSTAMFDISAQYRDDTSGVTSVTFEVQSLSVIL